MENKFQILADKIVLMEDGRLLAELDFPHQREGVVALTHTFVDESLRGRGIAGQLMETLLPVLAERGLKAVPICSYTVGWFERHPEAVGFLAG